MLVVSDRRASCGSSKRRRGKQLHHAREVIQSTLCDAGPTRILQHDAPAEPVARIRSARAMDAISPAVGADDRNAEGAGKSREI
jgi:hypothetical protein